MTMLLLLALLICCCPCIVPVVACHYCVTSLKHHWVGYQQIPGINDTQGHQAASGKFLLDIHMYVLSFLFVYVCVLCLCIHV